MISISDEAGGQGQIESKEASPRNTEFSERNRAVTKLNVRAFYFDPLAFAQHVPAMIHGSCEKMVTFLPSLTVEDLVQHCCAVIYRKRRHYRRRTGTIANWCNMMALRRCYDLARRQKRDDQRLDKLARYLDAQGKVGEVDPAKN